MPEIELPSVEQPNVLTKSLLLYERQATGLYVPAWLQGTRGAAHQYASIQESENVDIAGGDHVVGINGGLARVIKTDTDGEILKIDTTKQTGRTITLAKAGYHPYEVTKVYQTGSTIAGNVELGAW